MISKAVILVLVVATTVSGRIIQLRTNPHEMVLMPTLSNGCPSALEPAPLICKFMQPEDLHYKPPLIAPSTYIPPLVVESCDSPQLEIELPAPVEKKPRVIPSAPVLPPITIPKFPIPVVIEEPIPVSVPIVEPCEPAFIPELPAMDIPVAPALPPIVMPTLPEIVVQPEPCFDEVVPEVPMVVPQPPELPAFIMPELPVLVEAPMPEPCLEDQPIPVPMPEYILPAPMPLPIVEPAFVPEMPVLNIPAAPELPPLEMPALPEIVVEPCLDEVIVPEIPYRPVVVPQPPELPTFVMPELPVRVEAAMPEPCLDDQLIPVAPLPEYIPMPLPAPLPLPLAEPCEPVFIPQLPVNIPMAPALPPFAMPALPEIVAQPEPCLTEIAAPKDYYQPMMVPQAPELPAIVKPHLPRVEPAMIAPCPEDLPIVSIPEYIQPMPVAMPVYPESALADPCEPSARPVMAELPPYFVRHLPHKPMQPGHTFYPGGAYMNDHLPAMGAYPYVHHLQ